MVTRAIDGDKRELARLCEYTGQNILYLCVKIMGNYHDGEDAAQDILLIMQRDITKIQNPEAFKTWMYRLVVRNCVKWRNKKRQVVSVPIEEVSDTLGEKRLEFLPHHFAEQASSRESLLQAIDTLPDDCRTCLLLFYYKEMKYTEIADVMSLSTNDVGNLLVKAKKLLPPGDSYAPVA